MDIMDIMEVKDLFQEARDLTEEIIIMVDIMVDIMEDIMEDITVGIIIDSSFYTNLNSNGYESKFLVHFHNEVLKPSPFLQAH
jgi:hypothetical protein